MTLRYVCRALTAIVLTWGVPAIPAAAQTRDASLLPPEQGGVITVAGCLQPGEGENRYVLANPRLGPLANVTTETCDATVDHRTLDLKDTDQQGINRSMLGRWVEVNGRLEKETDTDLSNLRELEVRSFRMVPVVPPPPEPPRQTARVLEPQPSAPPAETAAPPQEQPARTTGIVETTLPRTAGSFSTIGLLGLLSLAGGLGLRFSRSGERG
jgi:hypothetical protein